MTSPSAQNAWGFRGERVQDAGLTACYNYFSKKKKKTLQIDFFPMLIFYLSFHKRPNNCGCMLLYTVIPESISHVGL